MDVMSITNLRFRSDQATIEFPFQVMPMLGSEALISTVVNATMKIHLSLQNVPPFFVSAIY